MLGGGQLKVVVQTRQTIEMDCIKKIGALLAAVAVILLLVGCSKQNDTSDSSTNEISETSKLVAIEEMTTPPPIAIEVKADERTKWTQEELQAIAKTLAGECYDDKPEDKRSVCEVILNRVSDGRFGGDTILEVLTEENQFAGYWKQSRLISDNDLEVAEKALSDWYENDCEPLSEYLFFYAGDNRENVFRSEY